MNLSEELRKLQELHRGGALTDEEFAAAKAAVLSQSKATDAGEGFQEVQERLKEVELQQELGRMDQEWYRVCEAYKLDVGNGNRFHVSKGGSVGFALASIGIGGLFAYLFAFGGPPFLWVWGFVMMLPGLVVSFILYRGADQLEHVRREYEDRRAAVLRRYREGHQDTHQDDAFYSAEGKPIL